MWGRGAKGVGSLRFVHSLPCLDAGIPIKAFDAAAYNVPIIISAPGNAGLRGTEDIGIIQGGGSPAEIAAAVVSLMTDNARHMRAVEGLVRFREKYSLAAFEQAVARMMSNIPRRACVWSGDNGGGGGGGGKKKRKQ
jgi:hypothetical protein